MSRPRNGYVLQSEIALSLLLAPVWVLSSAMEGVDRLLGYTTVES
jgi:hypothetical protein